MTMTKGAMRLGASSGPTTCHSTTTWFGALPSRNSRSDGNSSWSTNLTHSDSRDMAISSRTFRKSWGRGKGLGERSIPHITVAYGLTRSDVSVNAREGTKQGISVLRNAREHGTARKLLHGEQLTLDRKS